MRWSDGTPVTLEDVGELLWMAAFVVLVASCATNVVSSWVTPYTDATQPFPFLLTFSADLFWLAFLLFLAGYACVRFRRRPD